MTKRYRGTPNAAVPIIGLSPDQAAAMDAQPTLSVGNPVATQADLPTNPLDFKGEIAVAGDFPTGAAVQVGWWYSITAPVTDNDATKTNTGLSFVAGDEIYWSGSTWGTVGPLLTNKADKVSGATLNNFAGLDASGNLQDSGSKAGDFDVAGAASTVQGNLNTHTGAAAPHSGHADKVVPALVGNFAGLDAGGDLQDSGSKAADFAAASHNHDGSAITTGTVATARLSTGNTVNDVCVGNDSRLGPTFLDSVFRVQDEVDPTKQIAIQASGITTGTTRTITMSDGDVLLTGGSDGDVLTVQADGSYAPETPSTGQSIYDVIVDAAGGGDYTSIFTAFATEGANKSYLIKAGSYTEAGDPVVPSGAEITFESKNGGVVCTRTFTTGYTGGSEGAATIATATVSVAAVGIDLSDVQAHPGDYSLFFRGVEYDISSADNAAHTITLTASPPNPAGGGGDKVLWMKNFARNVTMRGKLTCTVYSELIGFADSNFSELDWTPLCSKTSFGSNVAYPKVYSSAADFEGAGKSRSILIGQNSWCTWPLVKITGGITNNALDRFSVELGATDDMFIDACMIHVMVVDMSNAGAASGIGVGTGNAARISDTVITGIAMNCDVNVQNLTNANTASLISS